MKLQFKEQGFQLEAVDAVCSLFEGQKREYSVFTVASTVNTPLMFPSISIANSITISQDEILKNMQNVQARNHLARTTDLAGMQFSIEMETGTGKTYVYTRTILELNKRYGFTKFIIVVPSIAIREGVYKSLQTTKEHFASIYNNPSVRYFIYNSNKLSDIRTFATASNIEIMIINIDAFKKAENVINQQLDRFFGEAAIDYVKKVHPIVIIDEPQSVDNTDKAKEAIASLNPLCVLRYSATHREKINLLYRLTPVDAYERKLVKQIFVASNKSEINFNKPYIKLISVINDPSFTARLEIDVRNKAGQIKRKTVSVKPNSDLYAVSGNRDLYYGYLVSGIDCEPGNEKIEFSNTESVPLGKAIGDTDDLEIKRVQIRRTIETHLDKELRYLTKGIKVLSLFFIDEVKKYRTPDGKKGIYAQIFEGEYYRLINLPKYAELLKAFPLAPESVHNGYFSQDKKGSLKNTRGDTQDDISTYNTIMKDKEWLLSFQCPLRFIFSHSALKEGWDNPNVFQVCTLIEQKSTLTARQKIGRGLRLCVNQNGERIEDPNINILHVMANESFAEFAENLQKEIEDDIGIKFGVLQQGAFSGLTFQKTETQHINLPASQLEAVESSIISEGFSIDGVNPQVSPSTEPAPQLTKEQEEVKQSAINFIKENGSINREKLSAITATVTVTVEEALSSDDDQVIRDHLVKNSYISKAGKILPKFNTAIKEGTFTLPKKYEPVKDQISNVLQRLNTKPPIKDASKNVHVKFKKEVTLTAEFKELWDRIKHKTTYRVHINDKQLVSNCVAQIREMPGIPKAKIVTETSKVDINAGGVNTKNLGIRTDVIENSYSGLPNLITELSSLTLTKRATVYQILNEANRYEDFLNNPQTFIERTAAIINGVRKELAINGITYEKLIGEQYFVQEVFDCDDILANLEKNAVPVEHSVYDHIIYDSSTIEKPFAEDLDNDPDVKMFLKLPDKFKIDTPIGTYNPDWAVYVDKDGMQKLYLVIETKGGTDLLTSLRPSERMKIECGEKHFKAIQADVALHLAKNWYEFKTNNL